jgi:carboxymethylenebutenolidase
VVLQEIFGVNGHIRWVADDYAADGYHVIAPALFDRAELGIELGYDKPDVDRGIALRQKIPLDQMLLDIEASCQALARSGKVGIVGYCLGGSLAWLAAARLPGISATIGYYGGMIATHVAESPLCPMLLHFGENDGGIPPDNVEKVRAGADPAMVTVFTYPRAGHAFNRRGNQAYHEASARLARERTVALLRAQVG